MLVSTGAEIVTGHKLLWPHDFFFFAPMVSAYCDVSIKHGHWSSLSRYRCWPPSTLFICVSTRVCQNTLPVSSAVTRYMQGVVNKAAICHNSAYIVQHNVLTVKTLSVELHMYMNHKEHRHRLSAKFDLHFGRKEMSLQQGCTRQSFYENYCILFGQISRTLKN